MVNVSVIMGVYNASKYIEIAIESILKQSYTDFEFIICDDGSIDNTLDKLIEIAKNDCRVKIIENKANFGLGYSLNRCIKSANGKYLIRMDGDDISPTDRIKKLVKLAEENPKYSVIGSAMVLFDDDQEWGETKPIMFPSKRQVFKGPAIAHATAIMRKEVITKIGGYNTACDKYRIEDYDMWCRLVEANYEIMNTTEVLYKCRWDQKDYYKRRKLTHLLGYAKYKFYWSKRLGFGINGYLHAFLVLIKAFVPTQIKKRYHRMKLNRND